MLNGIFVIIIIIYYILYITVNLRHGDFSVLLLVVLEILDQGLFNDSIELTASIKSQIAQLTHDLWIKGYAGAGGSLLPGYRATSYLPRGNSNGSWLFCFSLILTVVQVRY